ncbi:MAG: hypothetical protein C4547_10615 [Phycisphaerales bacterium]|nr:MAG: hypothetical protein C4547_10615 [Phycisphaerales bacterium]
MTVLVHLMLLAAPHAQVELSQAVPYSGDPKIPQHLLQSPRAAALTFLDDTWTFSPVPGSGGLRISRGVGGSGGYLDLDFDRELGQVLGFDVTCRQISPASVFVGVAAALLSPDGANVEYRFLFGRAFAPPDNLLDEKSWSYSAPLIARPVEKAFPAMSVNLLGGDSILVTLQDVARTPNGDRFETHRFVHHCPLAGRRLEQTRHYDDSAADAG